VAEIKISDNLAINYDPKIDSIESLESSVLSSYGVNKKFFRKNAPLVTITFVYNRTQINTILHRETKDWEVGYAYNHKDQINQIVIFSPEVMEAVSTHTKGDFILVLTHELAHIFTNNTFGFFYPIWLYEGLAGYVAKQYIKVEKIEKMTNFSLLHDKENWGKNINYSQAYIFTEYLMNKFTEEKMFQFFEFISKNLDKHCSYQDFENAFERFFRMKFSKTVVEWRKTLC
jgi:Peptidase of plants and bacteria